MQKITLNLTSCEDRALPSGTVIASFASGVLTLTGDDLNNEVLLVNTGTTLDVVGQNATTIPGVTSFTNVTGLIVNMKDGNDVLTINNAASLAIPGNVSLNMGDGDNSVLFDTAEKLRLGNVTITNGDGADIIKINGGLGKESEIGQLTVALGIGYNTQSAFVRPSTVELRNIKVLRTGGLVVNSLDGDERVTLNKVLATSPLTVNVGSGALTVDVTDSTFSAISLTSNGPNASSAGGIFFTPVSTTVSKTTLLKSAYGITVDADRFNTGMFMLQSGALFDSVIDVTGANNWGTGISLIGGKQTLRVNGQSQLTTTGILNISSKSSARIINDDAQISAKSIAVRAVTGVNIDLADDGVSAAVASYNVTGPVTINAGVITLDIDSGIMEIAGNLNLISTTGATLLLGEESASTATLAEINVNGSSLIKGSTVEVYQFESVLSVNNGLMIDSRDAAVYRSFPQQLTASPNFPNNPAYGNGATLTVNNKPFTMKGRIVTMDMVEGSALINTNMSLLATEFASLSGNVKIPGFNEDDSPNDPVGAFLTTDLLTMRGRDVAVNWTEGSLASTNGINLTGGLGGTAEFNSWQNNTATDFQGAIVSIVNGSLNITGDHVLFTQRDGTTTIAGGIKLLGTTSASFDVAIEETADKGIVTVQKDIIVESKIDTINFDHRGMHLTVQGNLNIKGPGLSQTSLNSVSTCQITGDVNIVGATNFDDYVEIATPNFSAKNVNINLGAGANEIHIGEDDVNYTIGGNLTVTTTSGSDVIVLGDTTVTGRTTINTGAGTDRLQLLEGAIFNGIFMADLGSGADDFRVGLDLLDDQNVVLKPRGVVTFNNQATAKLGANNDTLALGLAGDPDSKLLFGANGRLSVDGGLNANIYDDELGQFDTNKVTFIAITDPTP